MTRPCDVDLAIRVTRWRAFRNTLARKVHTDQRADGYEAEDGNGGATAG